MKTIIKSMPSNLLIHLVRFSFSKATGKYVKNSIPVTYPSEFDASRYAPGAGDYELNSVICHFGDTPNSGHYICYVKNNGRWFKCNDSSVTPVSEREALSQTRETYFLTYAKKSVVSQTTGTSQTIDTPPAEPTLTSQPVVIKPVSTISTVQQRPVSIPSFSLSSGIPDDATLEVFRVYN
jgi:hypothetical protein